MSLADLVRTDAPTRFGPLPVWASAQALEASAKPLVLAIQSGLAGPEDFIRLPSVLGANADAAVLSVFGEHGTALRDPSLAAAHAAVAEVIQALFPSRKLVLLGASAGALVALGVRHPAVRRVVALDPPLRTAGLWPLVEPFRKRLREQPGDLGARGLAEAIFGVTPSTVEARDYTALLSSLRTPADVMLGEEPLGEPRSLERLPSLVDVAARTALARSPRVRLHLAPGAGHDIQSQAGQKLRDLLLEAARRASAEPTYDPVGLDEVLLEATPLAARKVLHWGPGGAAFAGAYLSWNPAASVEVLGDAADAALAPGAGYEAIALGAPASPELLAKAAAALAPLGHLIARGASSANAPPQVRDLLAASGLALREPVDSGGSGVLRAQKLAPGQAPAAAVRVETISFAPFLMDVRTRLPARGLASDPELEVRITSAPHTLPPLPFDRPKVLVLQRLGRLPEGRELDVFAQAIARGWVVVLEYDDHPGLVAEVHGRPFSPDSLVRFGHAHAIQTSTEPLRELFSTVGVEVRIFENSVFELAPFPTQDPPRRVFYGAVARGGFSVEVARALAPVVGAFPDVEFVVLGDREVFDALPTARKRLEDFLPYEGYLARMAECQVSLSPIEDLPMRDAKSDAKFLDAARAGVLTIASPLIYQRTIRHGETGLIARSLEDWPALLTRALAEPAWRRGLARAAWDYVRAERMFADQVARRRAWYRELWEKRETLTAEAFARVPGLAQAVAARRARPAN